MLVKELIEELKKLPQDATIGITDWNNNDFRTVCYQEIDIVSFDKVINPRIYEDDEECDYYLE